MQKWLKPEAKAAEQQSDLILAKVCFKGVLAWFGILVGIQSKYSNYSNVFRSSFSPPFFAFVTSGMAQLTCVFLFFSSYLHAGPLSFACLFWAGSENFSSRAFASSISVSHCACPSKWFPLSRTVERDSNMFACLFVLDSTGIHCLGRQGACHV